ncbi:hypothetical protein COOONC_19225 [Cooperia oncophora]
MHSTRAFQRETYLIQACVDQLLSACVILLPVAVQKCFHLSKPSSFSNGVPRITKQQISTSYHPYIPITWFLQPISSHQPDTHAMPPKRNEKVSCDVCSSWVLRRELYRHMTRVHNYAQDEIDRMKDERERETSQVSLFHM